MRFNGSFIALILLCFGLAHAQSGQAELTGEVRDQTGAAVANATVKVTELSTNRTLQYHHERCRNLHSTNLKPGRYSMPSMRQASNKLFVNKLQFLQANASALM